MNSSTPSTALWYSRSFSSAYPEIGERDLFATYCPIEGIPDWMERVWILHDITDRKRAERTEADMTRKLMDKFSGSLPLDPGLPLFRVLQEAVNNSIKHSGQKRVEG